jgi:hypothetical protein
VFSRGILLNFPVQSGWGQKKMSGSSSSGVVVFTGAGWSSTDCDWCSC